MPQSTFVLTSETPRWASLDLPQSIAVIHLAPLPLDAAQQLVESVLGRSLSAAETPQLAALWQCFRGESTRMIQLAELQRESATAWDSWQAWWLAHPKPSLAQANRRLVEGLVADLDTPQRWILGLLTALDGVSLSQSQIAAITGPQDPRSSLQRLVRLGLVQVVEQRYRVVDHLKPWLTRQFDSQPWMARGLPVIEAWLCAQSPEALLPELPVALAFLRWAVQEKRSQSVLAMARSLDAALILGKQWEQWGRVLQWALQAAWQLADDRAAAWAWHQLGTRALLLDDITTAYDALQQALKLRQAAGDPAAIALTRANRDQVIQSALPTPAQAVVRAESGRQSGGQSGRQSQPYAALLVISIVTFMLALVAGLAIKSWVAPSPRSVPLSRQGQPPSAN
jgi:hypothetical protein